MSLLTGSSGAAVKRLKQRGEQVLMCKAGLLLHHGERRPGGHKLKLLCRQLVFEVQKLEDLQQNNVNNKHEQSANQTGD